MSERKCPHPQTHHIERAVKSRLFNVSKTVAYVEDKIDEAYERGLEASTDDAPSEGDTADEVPAEEGALFPDEEDAGTDTGK